DAGVLFLRAAQQDWRVAPKQSIRLGDSSGNCASRRQGWRVTPASAKES
ncbi:hypothetical protein A2U01_0075077, partial [Trifolium medium]|nr:hypothetical protein [Trifolium medium]